MSGGDTLQQETSALLHNFYQSHNPAKVSSIPDILQEYAGSELELVVNLMGKYSIGIEDLEQLLPDAELTIMLKNHISSRRKQKQKQKLKQKREQSKQRDRKISAPEVAASISSAVDVEEIDAPEAPEQTPVSRMRQKHVTSAATSPGSGVIQAKTKKEKEEPPKSKNREKIENNAESGSSSFLTPESNLASRSSNNSKNKIYASVGSAAPPSARLNISTSGELMDHKNFLHFASSERVSLSPTNLHKTATAIIQHLEAQNDELHLEKWDLERRLQAAGLSGAGSATGRGILSPPSSSSSSSSLSLSLSSSSASSNLIGSSSNAHLDTETDTHASSKETALQVRLLQEKDDEIERLREQLHASQQLQEPLQQQLNSTEFSLQALDNRVRNLEVELQGKERELHHKCQEYSTLEQAKDGMLHAFRARLQNQLHQHQLEVERLHGVLAKETQDLQRTVEQVQEEAKISCKEKQSALEKDAQGLRNQLNKVMRAEKERQVEVGFLQAQLIQAAEFVDELKKSKPRAAPAPASRHNYNSSGVDSMGMDVAAVPRTPLR